MVAAVITPTVSAARLSVCQVPVSSCRPTRPMISRYRRQARLFFSKHLADGSAYKNTILAQPTNPIQYCVVMNGTGAGTLAHANQTSVSVRCTNVGRFAYTNNVGSQSVSSGFAATSLSGFRIDAVTGGLRPVFGGSLELGLLWREGFAVDPLGRFAFSARQNVGFYSLLSTLSID